MVQALLKEVVDQTEGGLATLVMDFEGIALDSYAKPDAGLDMTTVGAEFSVIIKQVQRAAEMLEAGEAAELAVCSEKMTTVIRVVNETYFVAFSLKPDGNLGKARYMLRTRVPLLRKELS
jgi:predicted regulator of Ras-like GTPase activity (Roadblock/LC7/MglB family)